MQTDQGNVAQCVFNIDAKATAVGVGQDHQSEHLPWLLLPSPGHTNLVFKGVLQSMSVVFFPEGFFSRFTTIKY